MNIINTLKKNFGISKSKRIDVKKEVDFNIPFMEHPDGTFDTALLALEDMIKRLRDLSNQTKWITVCAQGYGGKSDLYHMAEIRILNDSIESDLSIHELLSNFDMKAASSLEVATFLDKLFREDLGILPFPGEGDDYAVGAEW